MRRTTTLSLFATGGMLILMGVLLLFDAGAFSHAQDGSPEYAGARECQSCHSDVARLHAETPHALALQDPRREENAILADFSTGEEVRTVTLPGQDEAQPFTAENIAYVIGTGRYVQRYVYEAGPAEYYVLPAEWNAMTGEWQAYTRAESWPDAAYDFMDNCAYCHVTNLDLRLETWTDDGVQCEACHGPGWDHIEVADDAGGRISDSERLEIAASINSGQDAQVCGQCHNAGQMADGSHPFPLGYLPGQQLVTEGGYQLVSPDDPDHWWPTGHAAISMMQYNEGLLSGHPSALVDAMAVEGFGVECLSCHSVVFDQVERAFLEADDDEIFIPLDAQRVLAGMTLTVPEEGWGYEPVLVEALGLLDVTVGEEDDLLEVLGDRLDVRIDDDDPILIQVIPALNMAFADAGVDPRRADALLRQLIPTAVTEYVTSDEDILEDATAFSSDELAHFGVTCSSCHSPHGETSEDFYLPQPAYDLCVSCHTDPDPTDGVHYPIRQVFEGLPLLAGIEGLPSGHFVAENGPDCATCHMQSVPTEAGPRSSHTQSVILPEEAIDIDAIEDGCTACHSDILDSAQLQTLIDDIQSDTLRRLEAARAAVTEDTPTWVTLALDIVESEGSLGIHNYAYTDELLDAAEVQLGLASTAQQ